MFIRQGAFSAVFWSVSSVYSSDRLVYSFYRPRVKNRSSWNILCFQGQKSRDFHLLSVTKFKNKPPHHSVYQTTDQPSKHLRRLVLNVSRCITFRFTRQHGGCKVSSIYVTIGDGCVSVSAPTLAFKLLLYCHDHSSTEP